MRFLFDKDTHRSTLPVRTISCPRRRNVLCMRVVSGKFSCTAECEACRPSDAPPAACRGTVCLSCDPAEAQLAEAPPAGLTARRSTACHPSDAPPAACRGTVCLSCDPAEAQLAEALSAGLAALPEHCLPERCLPKYRQLTSAARPKFRLPVLRPCRSTARRSAARRSCGPPEHCLPERCLPKYRQLTSAARPKFRLPVLRLCRSTARRSAARRPRYAKKRSSSSRAAMSDSAMRRLSFDLSV